MKQLICLILLAYWTNNVHSQTKTEKIVSVKAEQTINLDFTWPALITIKSWDRNEVKLVASAEINKGQNDEAFIFEINESSAEVTIASLIRDFNSLPKKIVFRKDGQEYFFNTDDYNNTEVLAFKKKHGHNGYESMSHGVIMDITLEVWVPASAKLDVYSKFGMVEVQGFTGDMHIHSKFGGVDVSTSGNQAIKAGTKFGEKYSNLDGEIETISFGDHPGTWDWVMVGSGRTQQEVKTDFGDIYLRKGN